MGGLCGSQQQTKWGKRKREGGMACELELRGDDEPTQMVTAPAATSRSCLLLLQDIGVTGVTHGCATGAAEAFAEVG